MKAYKLRPSDETHKEPVKGCAKCGSNNDQTPNGAPTTTSFPPGAVNLVGIFALVRIS
jgi:hypothetical protein